MKILLSFINNRKLIIYLSKNDFKTKYTGSYLGIIWAFVQPVITLLLYWFVFQIGLRSGNVEDTPFVLWLMAGLIPWLFFSEALTNVANCFIEYSYLVKKVVFNINILPVVKIISALYVHIFFVLLMLVVFGISGYYPGVILLQLIYYTCCMIILIIALGYFSAAINIFFKDTIQIIGVLMQIGLWITPILWNKDMLPQSIAWIFKLNPMYYIVQGYRDTMITGIWFFEHFYLTIYYWLLVLVLLLISKHVYTKLKPHFSDSL